MAMRLGIEWSWRRYLCAPINVFYKTVDKFIIDCYLWACRILFGVLSLGFGYLASLYSFVSDTIAASQLLSTQFVSCELFFNFFLSFHVIIDLFYKLVKNDSLV